MSQPAHPKPNDDPALAMCLLWQADCDLFEEAVAFASRREREWMDAGKARRAEAERLYLTAAKVRDRKSDKLEVLARAIFKTKAQSFEGASAKLGVALRGNERSPDDPMPPWPELRSVKADFDRLVAAARAALPSGPTID